MLKNNDWTTRGSFSFWGWIACKLHADPMIPQIPPKSTFPVKIFFRIFLLLSERKPNNIPKFHGNRTNFIFWPIWHSTPYQRCRLANGTKTQQSTVAVVWHQGKEKSHGVWCAEPYTCWNFIDFQLHPYLNSYVRQVTKNDPPKFGTSQYFLWWLMYLTGFCCLENCNWNRPLTLAKK